LLLIHTTSLSDGAYNPLDNVDRLALLASAACRSPRMSKRPFDDLCPEMVPLLIAALPNTSWYRKDLVSPSSVCAGRSSKRLKEKHGSWSATMPTSGSVSSDNEDDVNSSDYGRKSNSEQPIITHAHRKILPLPKGAKQPEPVQPRERFLKSLIQPRHFPAANARKTVEERLQFLQRDPWVDVKSIGRHRVVCNECREPVKLDSRGNAAYYPNAWLRHRRRCLEIYRTSLAENRYDDSSWIQKAERRRYMRLQLGLEV
ncbi:hypothetical protein F5146DRAFT_173272, partial [Armillaria mellea]